MEKARRDKILSTLWAAFQDLVLNNASELTKLIIMKALKSGAAGGFKTWLIKFLATELSHDILEPSVKIFFAEVGYQYDRLDGLVIVKKIERAREENNASNYNTAVDDIFSK